MSVLTEYGARAIPYILNSLEVKGQEALILLYLAAEADENGRVKADMGRLATQIGCKYRALKNYLKHLRALGLLSRINRDGSVSKRGEFYQLSLDVKEHHHDLSDPNEKAQPCPFTASNPSEGHDCAISEPGTEPALYKTLITPITNRSYNPIGITPIKLLTSPTPLADKPPSVPAMGGFTSGEELLAKDGAAWREILQWFEENVPLELSTMSYPVFVDWALIPQREYWGGRALRGESDADKCQLLVLALKKWFHARYKEKDYALYDQLFCRVVCVFGIQHEHMPRDPRKQAIQKQSLIRLKRSLQAEGLSLEEYAAWTKQILNYRSHVNLTVDAVISEQIYADVRTKREAKYYADHPWTTE